MKSRRATPQLTLPFTQTRPAPRRELQRDEATFEPVEIGLALPAVETPAHDRGPGRPRPDRRVSSSEQVDRLVRQLKGRIGSPVMLHVHDNRSTMVSFRRDDEVLHLRVHHMFLDAGPEIVRALADYARVRSLRAGRVLDQYVRENREAIKQLAEHEIQARPLRTLGDIHDLSAIYTALNRRYFRGSIDARIGWGRGSGLRRRRSIRMGAYYRDTRTILIHPALDRPEVPRYFVELVVYHEMLHQAVPQQRESTGRRSIHSPEFRAREREFHEFERARIWERRNLGLLLRPIRSRG